MNLNLHYIILKKFKCGHTICSKMSKRLIGLHNHRAYLQARIKKCMLNHFVKTQHNISAQNVVIRNSKGFEILTKQHF